MMTDPDDPDVYRSWQADDWDVLRTIWTDLYPSEEEAPRFGPDVLTPQQAGWVFERWILEAFRLSGAAGHYPYDNPQIQEQIDGLVFDGWQGFLIESKFQSRKIDIDPIYRLHVIVEQRLVGALGLFFSASGFTVPAVEKARALRPIRVLLFEADDLNWALQRPGSMMTMVQRKWLLALKEGHPNARVVQPVDLFGGSSPNAIS
jgi:hypothetical protein